MSRLIPILAIGPAFALLIIGGPQELYPVEVIGIGVVTVLWANDSREPSSLIAETVGVVAIGISAISLAFFGYGPFAALLGFLLLLCAVGVTRQSYSSARFQRRNIRVLVGCAVLLVALLFDWAEGNTFSALLAAIVYGTPLFLLGSYFLRRISMRRGRYGAPATRI